MSDFEKEKQAYYHLKELYVGKPTPFALAEMADSGDLLDIVAEFIKEHEAETTRLRAEIDLLRRDEKDRAKGNQEYAHFRRRQRLKKCQAKHKRALKKNEKLRAEIERKDERVSILEDHIVWACAHYGIVVTDGIFEVLKQALQNKEESGENI